MLWVRDTLTSQTIPVYVTSDATPNNVIQSLRDSGQLSLPRHPEMSLAGEQLAAAIPLSDQGVGAEMTLELKDGVNKFGKDSEIPWEGFELRYDLFAQRREGSKTLSDKRCTFVRADGTKWIFKAFADFGVYNDGQGIEDLDPELFYERMMVGLNDTKPGGLQNWWRILNFVKFSKIESTHDTVP